MRERLERATRQRPIRPVSGAYIGLDAGTSEIKAALFDERFRQLREARVRIEPLRPAPGHSELEPEAVLDAVRRALECVTASGPDGPGGTPAALGVTGAMVGAWTLDGEGAPIGRGILWDDCRSEPELARLRAAHPDFDRRVFASSGSVLQQGCTLPLMAWMERHAPERLERARHVVGLKDFLRAALTDRIDTDVGEAAVAPGDARERGRSDAMLALFGLRRWADRLPTPRPFEALAGRVTARACARFSLPEGLPVAIGAGDVPSSVLGAGGLEPGSTTVVLGTTCLVGRCTGSATFEPPGLGLLFAVPAGRWFRAMVNVAGTANLDWARATLVPHLGDDFDAIEALAASSAPGAGGVTWLPYLSESGIIAPVVDASARAGFDGIAPRATSADLLRAVYEGTVHAIADCVELLGDDPGGRLRLVGGGARSELWTQMLADTLARPVERIDATQLGARGAAMLAAVAAGHHPSVDAARAHASEAVRVTAPGPDRQREGRVRWLAHRDRRLAQRDGDAVYTTHD